MALFALMGPFIGAIIPVMLSLGELPELMQIGSPLKAFGFILAFGVVIAYVLGAPQALLTGLVMGFWYRRTGAISLWGAALCALAALGLRLGIVGLPHFGGREPLSLDTDGYLWLVLGHLMAALACAWLARRLFVPVRSSGDR
ncbi:hypothetical protein [Maritimibacter fusiformis]|uniref:hypothetical protein n=1 Tax=Maritimibacter fusiformis TaxID=2603819 RepID=UPI0011DE20A0|nr:hypothetical protein [Maritimibacter fusiformis]